MLSNEEKEELRTMARSAQLREDCLQLQALNRQHARHMTPDDVIQFLTFLQQLPVRQPPPRSFQVYTRVLL